MYNGIKKLWDGCVNNNLKSQEKENALLKAIDNLELKFTSGNDIEVERATILKSEWDAIYPYLRFRQDKITNLSFRHWLIVVFILLPVAFFIWLWEKLIHSLDFSPKP